MSSGKQAAHGIRIAALLQEVPIFICSVFFSGDLVRLVEAASEADPSQAGEDVSTRKIETTSKKERISNGAQFFINKVRKKLC